jgi:hypothetical protein
MSPWLRSLSELRRKFASRIDDDLGFLAVTAWVSAESLQTYTDEALQSDKATALALPDDDDPSWGDNGWREGKPILRDLEARRIEKKNFIYRTNTNCKLEDDPAYEWASENREKLARDYCYYSRHVLFGNADQRSIDDFDRWADDAARYYTSWAVLNFKPKSEDEKLRVVGYPNRDYWMDYIIILALKKIPGCPLVVRNQSTLASPLSAFNGPHWRLLGSNLFRASVDAIDTVLWLEARKLQSNSILPPNPGDATPSHSVGRIRSDQATEAPEITNPYCQFETFGQLLINLESSERAFQANMRGAERSQAQFGSLVAYSHKLEAHAFLFQPDPAQMPGVERIEALVLEEFGAKLSAECVRKLKGRLCRSLGCPPEQVDALTMIEVAEHLERATKPNDQSKDDEMVTVTEAAKITALSKGQISKLCNGGVIPTNGKRGRERRIHAAGLMRWWNHRDKN